MRFRLQIVILMIGQVLMAQKPVVLTDMIYEQALYDYQIWYLNDLSCNIQPAEIFSGNLEQGFKELDFSDPDADIYENREGTCLWFRFTIENRSIKQFSFHLQPNIFSEFSEFRLYQQYDNGIITERRSGNSILPRNKDVNISGSDELRFFISPGESDTIFLRVELSSESVLSDLTFTVSTQENVISKDRSKRLLFGIFLGIMLIMILPGTTTLPTRIRSRLTMRL